MRAPPTALPSVRGESCEGDPDESDVDHAERALLLLLCRLVARPRVGRREAAEAWGGTGDDIYI